MCSCSHFVGCRSANSIALYRSLIRSTLNYGCVVYGSARGSYLQMLDPIQNHALWLSLGAFCTSPSSILCVLANEPPLYVRKKMLPIQYSLKLSSNLQNPSYITLFNYKFKVSFEQKPHQIPPLGSQVQADLHAVGFLCLEEKRFEMFNSGYPSLGVQLTAYWL